MTHSEIFSYILLPLLIFFARICDVTIGTIRIILVSKGQKLLAPLLGFFEILIWIIAISKIMENLNNVACYIGYAAGFATGNYIGMLVEEKLAMGVTVIRIITQKAADELIKNLSLAGYGITNIDAKGSRGDVNIIYTVIQRHDLQNVINIIKEFNPKAFYTIEDLRFVSAGISQLNINKKSSKSLLFRRKGK
ncbi:MAG: DUF2179 domain-containing protein [Bacteroidales bacterium]|nr:DUF2179 domain-containing protein [Bacteroidales bacterium]